MGRKAKVNFDIKVKSVELYLSGVGSYESISNKISVSACSLRSWVRIYQSFGPSALLEVHKNSSYSSEIKVSAVLDYLGGKGSLHDIQLKYGLKSHTQLCRWIKQYNSHEKLKSSYTGGKLMTNGRKTTFDERVEIVKHCIENNRNYTATAAHFKVSYQQIYSWVQKYDRNGVEALQDNRGKAKPEAQMSELERLRAQNKLLEAENKRKQMEIDFLKKLEEMERRRS